MEGVIYIGMSGKDNTLRNRCYELARLWWTNTKWTKPPHTRESQSTTKSPTEGAHWSLCLVGKTRALPDCRGTCVAEYVSHERFGRGEH